MGQQEYDAFREQMKQWMLDNSDIYDEFEEMMTSKSDEGYNKILAQAITLVPKYQKAISQKMNRSSLDDTADIEKIFADLNIGAALVAQFDDENRDTIMPSIICWLFFGRSFENIVERGEEIINNPNINRFQSFLIARTTKILIKRSISLGLRTRQDWDEYYELKKIIDSNQIGEWALNDLEESEEEATPLNHPEGVSTLESMILLDSEKKNILIVKIGEYLNTGVKGKRVAFMILALRSLGYLPTLTSDKKLFEALKKHFNTYIGSDKSIYAYLENGISKQFKPDIDNLAAYFKVD